MNMMKNIFVFLTLILISTLASAETWECTAKARKVFPARGFLDLIAPVSTKSNPNAKSPKIAAIKAIDSAFNATTERGTCNVETTLNSKFKNQWPNYYGWIHHWKITKDQKVERVTDSSSELIFQHFENEFNDAVAAEAEFIINPDTFILGCYYYCRQTP